MMFNKLAYLMDLRQPFPPACCLAQAIEVTRMPGSVRHTSRCGLPLYTLLSDYVTRRLQAAAPTPSLALTSTQ